MGRRSGVLLLLLRVGLLSIIFLQMMCYYLLKDPHLKFVWLWPICRNFVDSLEWRWTLWSPKCFSHLACHEFISSINLICSIPLTNDIGKYLGILLSHKRSSKVHFHFIIQKMEAKLMLRKAVFSILLGELLLLNQSSMSF